MLWIVGPATSTPFSTEAQYKLFHAFHLKVHRVAFWKKNLKYIPVSGMSQLILSLASSDSSVCSTPLLEHTSTSEYVWEKDVPNNFPILIATHILPEPWTLVLPPLGASRRRYATQPLSSLLWHISSCQESPGLFCSPGRGDPWRVNWEEGSRNREVHRAACFSVLRHALTFMLWQILPTLNTQGNTASMFKKLPVCDWVNLTTLCQYHSNWWT